MKMLKRITYKDKDYYYELITNALDDATSELELLLNGERIGIMRDSRLGWVQSVGDVKIPHEFSIALGRSITSLYRI